MFQFEDYFDNFFNKQIKSRGQHFCPANVDQTKSYAMDKVFHCNFGLLLGILFVGFCFRPLINKIVNWILVADALGGLDLNFVSGNAANYLKLQEVDSIFLPVPVNFIFIGFEGSGNQGGSFLIWSLCFVSCWKADCLTICLSMCVLFF